MSAPARRAKVERSGAELSVRRQCALLNVARSGVYRPRPETSADDLALMRRIDELYLEKPFYGSRRMTFDLNEEGRGVNRKRVQRLMRLMGLEGLVPRPGTSKAAPGAKIYPYLLRGVSITEPNHVWALDITYIPMASGFLYLVAVIDWASRAVLAWRLSNTMDSSFCVESQETSSINEQPTTNECVAGRHQQARKTVRSCGYDASLGQRKRVAHIPTVGAEKGEESGLKIFTNRKRRERAGAYAP
jgi:putative transposase